MERRHPGAVPHEIRPGELVHPSKVRRISDGGGVNYSQVDDYAMFSR
jgi:hypothetical protein